MPRSIVAALYVLAMMAAVVSADFLFLGHRFWARLFTDIGSVAVSAAAYLRLMKRP